MYWYKLLDEILNKEIQSKQVPASTIKQTGSHYLPTSTIKKQNFSYKSGRKHRNIHFTARETQCMLYTLRGYTFKNIGTALNLSPRTIEYYLKNMKKKIGCKTKYQLIDIVLTSDFLKKAKEII